MEVFVPYGAQRIKLPEDNWIYFKEIKKMLKLPFMIFSDFETLNTKVESCEPNKGTEEKTTHVARGFNYVVISPKEKHMEVQTSS